MSNEIHPTAQVPDDIVLGQYNTIGPHVTISGFKGQTCGLVVLGDCNVIHEGVRIMVGPEGFSMGDYCTIHNHCTLGGPGKFVMGHNCWLGQRAWLDSTGGLTLGNGVRIALCSHIWSHLASGERIEGWLYVLRPTALEDDVWLVGDSVHIASGVTMGERSVAMAHATVTRDTKPDTVYVGTPAREIGFKLRRDITQAEKWEMMMEWAEEFTQDDNVTWSVHLEEQLLEVSGALIPGPWQRLFIGFGQQDVPESDSITYFDLTAKTYTKRLTQLERDFIYFLKGNRARFLPAL